MCLFKLLAHCMPGGCSHTLGHICYLCKEAGSQDIIFTGDTMFVGGCGR